jgi:hypothetical protein
MQVTLKPGLLQHHELVPLLLPTRRLLLLLLLLVVPLLFGLGSGVFFSLLLEGFCNERTAPPGLIPGGRREGRIGYRFCAMGAVISGNTLFIPSI